VFPINRQELERTELPVENSDNKLDTVSSTENALGDLVKQTIQLPCSIVGQNRVFFPISFEQSGYSEQYDYEGCHLECRWTEDGDQESGEGKIFSTGQPDEQWVVLPHDLVRRYGTWSDDMKVCYFSSVNGMDRLKLSMKGVYMSRVKTYGLLNYVTKFRILLQKLCVDEEVLDMPRWCSSEVNHLKDYLARCRELRQQVQQEKEKPSPIKENSNIDGKVVVADHSDLEKSEINDEQVTEESGVETTMSVSKNNVISGDAPNESSEENDLLQDYLAGCCRRQQERHERRAPPRINEDSSVVGAGDNVENENFRRNDKAFSFNDPMQDYLDGCREKQHRRHLREKASGDENKGSQSGIKSGGIVRSVPKETVPPYQPPLMNEWQRWGVVGSAQYAIGVDKAVEDPPDVERVMLRVRNGECDDVGDTHNRGGHKSDGGDKFGWDEM